MFEENIKLKQRENETDITSHNWNSSAHAENKTKITESGLLSHAFLSVVDGTETGLKSNQRTFIQIAFHPFGFLNTAEGKAPPDPSPVPLIASVAKHEMKENERPVPEGVQWTSRKARWSVSATKRLWAIILVKPKVDVIPINVNAIASAAYSL